jgi:hypothetical protein
MRSISQKSSSPNPNPVSSSSMRVNFGNMKSTQVPGASEHTRATAAVKLEFHHLRPSHGTDRATCAHYVCEYEYVMVRIPAEHRIGARFGEAGRKELVA